VSRVALVAGRVVAVVAGRAYAESPTGFAPTSAPPRPSASVSVGGVTWAIDPAGEVTVAHGSSPAVQDPGSPDLGPGAHLIAAPLGLPPGVPPASVVVAVSESGIVWRRAPDGIWSVSLVLLPTVLGGPTPAVTSIAAFSDSAQSSVVYIGTHGYGTLLTDDGGDDWTRAAPGLPADVSSLVADPAGQGAVWAGTDRGLYVHRLQALPAIPSYSGQSLTGKWLLTLLVCTLTVLTAAAGLVVWSRRQGRVAPASPRQP
jgi:hypothetical protein